MLVINIDGFQTECDPRPHLNQIPTQSTWKIK